MFKIGDEVILVRHRGDSVKLPLGFTTKIISTGSIDRENYHYLLDCSSWGGEVLPKQGGTGKRSWWVHKDCVKLVLPDLENV